MRTMAPPEDAMKERFARIDERFDRADERILDVDRRITETSTATNRRIDDVKTEVSEVKTEMSEVKTEVSKLQQGMGSLHTGIHRATIAIWVASAGVIAGDPRQRRLSYPPIGALGFAPQKTTVPSMPMMWTATMLKTIDFAVAVPTPTGPPEAV
jgi:hypothetical protein